MAVIAQLSAFVGEHIPVRYSFLSLLKNFHSSNQTLTGASVTWTSQSPLVASFDVGSNGLVSSDQGLAAGIPNDACIGRFHMLAAGRCTVQVQVDAVNPVATYVGIVQFQIEAVPTP